VDRCKVVETAIAKAMSNLVERAFLIKSRSIVNSEAEGLAERGRGCKKHAEFKSIGGKGFVRGLAQNGPGGWGVHPK